MRADLTDNELVAAVGLGDASALGLLFERHHERVHSLCYRMTGDPSAADDLVQDSFVRVFRYARGFKESAAFTTWLYRLVRNVCLQHLNAESRQRARLELMTSGRRSEDQSQQQIGTMGPEEDDPRLARIRRALYALSPDKREVLVLSRYEGLTYAEIADVCETTVGAIKVRAHRAMRELRQEYEELEGTS